MLKSIIKEISIILLLCIAIILILAILFYEYIPSNKVVPNKIAYNTPENVTEEIDENITEYNKTEISYEITDSDLYLYQQSNVYTPGKKDPFSTIEEDENNVNNTNIDNNSQNNVNDNDSNVDSNSTGSFFNETGLK